MTTEEKHIQKNQANEFKLERVSQGVYFEATRACNLSCKYCYSVGKNEESITVGTAIIKQIIRALANAGNHFLIISGGEPLVRKDIFEILDFACSVLPVSLLTNATLINMETALRLAQFNFLQVRVSIDGHLPDFHDPLRGSGSFRQTMIGVKNLLKAGLRSRISFCMTISSLNAGVIREMARFTVGLGIPSLVVTPVVRIGKAKKIWDRIRPNAEQLAKMYRDLYEIEMEYSDRLQISGSLKSTLLKAFRDSSPLVRCPVGQRIAVDFNGNVYPCSLLMDGEPSGNILLTPLPEILSGDKMNFHRKKALERMSTIAQCRICKWNRYCTGGCMARAYSEYGTLLAPDPDCETIRALMEDFVAEQMNEDFIIT